MATAMNINAIDNTHTGKPLLVGVFNDRYQAEKAVDDLEQGGFGRDQIGFALRGPDAVSGGVITDAVGSKDAEGAVTGAVTGGIVGGLLGAAVALAIPGVGPLLAGGILATALGYGAAGVAVGGLLGAMTGAGLSEDEARFYEAQFNEGRALVTVRAGAREAEATEIIRRHGGYDMHTFNAAINAQAAASDLRDQSHPIP
jgi:hypothetical protein